MGGDTLPRVARRLAIAVVALVPIAAWPGLGDPFVTLRSGVLTIGTAAILAALGVARASWRPRAVLVRGVAGWLAALSFSAAFAPFVSLGTLLQELLAVAWAAALIWAAPRADDVMRALARVSVIVAVWAVLQWAGIDPWSMIGWQVTGEYGPRMRVYGPLGNPNYVGAFLAAVWPLMISRALARGRQTREVGAAAVVALGIVATGSRGAWLGCAVGTAWLAAASSAGSRVPRILTAVVVVLGIGIALGPTRSVAETIRGRAYIWIVAAPHLLEHPWTGWGPGSFDVTYPSWERERIERGVDRDVRTFAAAQRHAHNDYVERLSDLGVPGLAAWVILLATILRTGRANHSAPATAVAASAGLAALAAVSVVDFPLQRPVERFTWWTLAVLAAGLRAEDPGE